MQQVFSGTRVVEISGGMAGSLAAMVMADNGAEVIKVEPPAGDETRSSPGFLMWNRGKKSVVLDLDRPADCRTARDLVLTADVLIESFRPGEAGRYGFTHAELSQARPDLVHCAISGFGLAGEHEHLAPYGEIVMAKSGRVNGNDALSGALFTGRPIFIATPIPSFGAGGLALQGITAALFARERTGRGQKVETSLLDGISATTMRLAYERKGQAMVSAKNRGPDTAFVLRRIALCFIAPKCKDGGYIQMCARQVQHFRNWLQAMELGDLLQTERFKDVPLGIRTDADLTELEAMIRERMATKTRAEWIEIFSTVWDVGADPFLTPAEFLQHPQMRLNDRIVEIDDPVFGTVTQVGPLVLFSETPSRISASAPSKGQHQAELPALLARKAGVVQTVAPKVAPASDGQGTAAPLEGVTILELATFLASPLGPTLLAEMGARVIKIEPLDGDPFRKAGLEVVHLVHGKESLAIDMKSDAGREIVRRAVRRCDALIHNFRPGVPERLGVDYESLRRIKPDLVYLYGASYGSKGPESHRPAFHSTPHALNGAGILQAGRGNPPVDDSYPDPCSGIGAGMALVMGLLARQKTGKGQCMETTMLATSGYVHGERLTHYKGMPELPTLDGQQLGMHALNRLYKTQAGWLMLCAMRDAEWESLARAVGHPEWIADPRFSNADRRHENDDALVALLERLFAGQDAANWERLLCDAGVPAAMPAESFEDFAFRSGILESDEHPTFGSYWRLKPRVRFSSSPARQGRPCAVGEHSRALLKELGYDDAAIQAMERDKVVGGVVANAA